MECNDTTLLDEIRKEIERVKSELNGYISNFPSVSKELAEDQIGDVLLEAFLNDLPFDRYVFALKPIKIAFLDAAFRTNDLEIIYEAFMQIKLTMNNKAFDELLDLKEKYRNTYRKLTKKQSRLITMEEEDESNIDFLNDELRNSQSELMSIVLSDAVKRAEKKNHKDKYAGYEEIDFKWNILISGLKDPKSMQPVRKMICPSGVFNNKLAGIPPIQGALYAKSRKAPPNVINEFAKYVEKDEIKELNGHQIKII